MKTLQIFICSLLLAFILPKCASGQEEQTAGEGEKTYYYGVEISGVLCGYATVTSTPGDHEGRSIERQTGNVTVKLSVLGGGVDMAISYLYLIDPSTEQFFYNATTVDQGNVTMDFTSTVKEDTILFVSASGNDKKSIPMTPGLILEGPLTTKHIVSDFIHGDAKEKTYMVYDGARGKVFEKSYIRMGDETLELAGQTYHCLILDEMNPALGVTPRQWYDMETGLNVQTLIATRKIYLAEPAVIKQITTANLDDLLFAKVNTRISDIHNIESMKVEAKIRSAGEQLSVESLNHVGQSFTGNVTDNLIEGVFEMTPERYEGAGAPPFPPNFSDDPSLNKYLNPENLIESNDPILIAKAREITTGSADSWEASKRLSKWVAENIEGAIPGGTSAINTYKTRQGECGSHSRLLVAFNRAVGIPSRLATGCMYSSLYGGSFGQHVWTEVYMGEAGWIQVDATAFEIDFIDAGHIRLGVGTSFNPEAMKILEYRMKEGVVRADGDEIPVNFQAYPGKYTDLDRNRIFTVTYQNKGLAVDIPGQMVMALNPPDEEERWYPQITRQLFFRFPKNTAGIVEKLVVTQSVPIPRTENADTILQEIPERFAAYTGTYSLPQAQINFNVTVEDETLTIPDLIGRTSARVKLTETEKGWTSDNGRYMVTFDRNENGDVTRLVAAISFTFKKGEPAATIIEKVIEEEGIESGLNRYQELKDENHGSN